MYVVRKFLSRESTTFLSRKLVEIEKTSTNPWHVSLIKQPSMYLLIASTRCVSFSIRRKHISWKGTCNLHSGLTLPLRVDCGTREMLFADFLNREQYLTAPMAFLAPKT